MGSDSTFIDAGRQRAYSLV